jgi:cytoskeletal protein CcmA (bactofilin family)
LNAVNKDSHGLQPRMNNEEGSALVIALLAVVLMTMMGLILMSVLRGGAIQAATTESGVQAETIAQKGLDDTLAQIRRAVANGESLGGANYRNRVLNVENQLSLILPFIDKEVGDGTNLEDENGEVVEAKRGKYRIDILSAKTLSNPESPIKPLTNPDSPYVRKFLVRSRGIMEGNPGEIVTKQMTVYVSTINPVFRYPVSSGGDLILNGTPSIVGDIYVANQLQIRDEAIFTGTSSGSNRSKFGIQTGLPAIRGFIRVNGSATQPGKFKLTQSDGVTEFPPVTATSEIVQPSYFTPQFFPLEDPTLDADVDVDVRGYVTKKTQDDLTTKLDALGGYKAPDPELLEVPLFSDLTKSTLYNDQWVNVQGAVQVKDAVSATNEADVFVNNGVLTMESADSKLTLVNGSLYVKSPDPNLIAADLRGSLSLSAGEFVAVDGNVTINSGFEFPQGSMYINGDLKIIGDIRLQGTVYVAGNVELKEMTSINKKREGDTAPIPLIVIASGEIVLGNNSNAGDEEVRAFFYSKEGIRLYGVMSKLNLTGGIHGGTRGVELNAVRGDLTSGGGSSVTRYQGASNWNKDVPEVQLNNTKPSRLQIMYDDNLYDLPPDGIPTTDNFNVFVKNVQYIK